MNIPRYLLTLPGLATAVVAAHLGQWGNAAAWHGTNSPNPDLGWTWKDATLVGGSVVDDHTSGTIFTQPINDLVANWYNATKVKPTKGSLANHSSNRVHYWEVNAGTNGYLGQTQPYSIEGYSSLQPCTTNGAPNGVCNKTNHRATYADINLNLARLGSGKDKGTDGNRRHTVGHELGHIYGLSHPSDCSPPSGSTYEAIVRQTGCGPLWTTVRGHDQKDIGVLYP